MNIKQNIMDKLNIGVICLLLDPHNNDVRYVGQTRRNPHIRYLGHKNKRDGSSRSKWIHSLSLPPKLMVWRVVSRENLNEAEIRAIAYFRGIGCNLTNSSDGGLCGTMSDETKIKISIKAKRPRAKGSKITFEQGIDICTSDLTLKELAKKYKCSYVTIWEVRNGKKTKTWRNFHLEHAF